MSNINKTSRVEGPRIDPRGACRMLVLPCSLPARLRAYASPFVGDRTTAWRSPCPEAIMHKNSHVNFKIVKAQYRLPEKRIESGKR